MLRIRCFNSRTPGGVRLLERVLSSLSLRFNSRTPGGVRRSSRHGGLERLGFNSRTPGGVRLLRLVTVSFAIRFNSRTPGGVRRVGGASCATDAYVSIHAPREGCDYTTSTLNNTIKVSIHAPREGCDERCPS